MLKHFTDKKAVQLIATDSRRTDITPYQLSQVHIEMGKYLAYEILEELDLEDCEIQHPQGIKIGRRLKNEKDVLILDFMRAGVYLGDGLRFIFQTSPYFHITPKRGEGLSEIDLSSLKSLEGKIIILVDSVINTGNTMMPVIEQISKFNPEKIFVTCQVMPYDTAEILEKKYPDVLFFIFRLSYNKYVGKGKTDTGNRLFGTL